MKKDKLHIHWYPGHIARAERQLKEKLNLVDSKVLLVVEELNDNVCLASRNLGNVKVVLPNEVCTYDVVNCDKLVITNEALSKLEEVLSCE